MLISHLRNEINQNHIIAIINHNISFKFTFSFRKNIQSKKVKIISLLLKSHIGQTHQSFIAVAQALPHIAQANQININIFQ